MKQQAKSRKPQQPEYIFRVETLLMRGGELRIMVLIQTIRQISMVKKCLFVMRCLGETVKAQITHEAKRLEEAEMVALLAEPSANRVEAVCPHYGICGGVACSIFTPMSRSV